jgi:hypothetical protein
VKNEREGRKRRVGRTCLCAEKEKRKRKEKPFVSQPLKGERRGRDGWNTPWFPFPCIPTMPSKIASLTWQFLDFCVAVIGLA